VAQTTVATTPGGVPISLEAVGGGNPFAAAALGPGAPGATSAVISSNVGFSYLRPFWATSGLNLQAPVGANSAVTVVSPFGDLTNNFGFVPRVDLQYDASSLGFGMATSAQFLSLGGNLERTVTTNAGTADLIATSELTFVAVTLAEITKTVRAVDVSDHPLIDCLGLQDDIYGFTLGTRFVSIRQSWDASLRTNTAALAAADATQTFAGLGLTSAFAADHPVTEKWGLYSNTRGSILLGPNNRKSAVNGVDAAGVPFSNSLVENKTTLIPAAELEFGVRYMTPFNSQQWAQSGTGPMLSIRAGVVGQYWGNIGFLPANPGAAQFDNRPLYLVGFTLLAGVEF
jgi:hypothetical protein